VDILVGGNEFFSQELFLVLLLSYRIKKLEDSWFKLLFRSDFLNTPTRYSVKCIRGHKLFFDSIFIVDLGRGLASSIPCFHCGS
jgi:hypothetical protein